MTESHKPAPDAEKKPVMPVLRRRYQRRVGDQQSESSFWMITFTDIMGLMLTFFVMMYAMSNPRIDEWEGISDNIQKNFNRYYGEAGSRGFQEAISIDKIDFSHALDLNYLRALIGSLLEKEGSLSRVTMINQSDSLILSLPQDLLFEPSRADLKKESGKPLYAIAEMLTRIKNRVEIVGHSDPRPISNKEFPSNWDLSIARAARVAAALQAAGYTKSVTIRGSSAGRYDDLPPGLTETEKLDISRRVDIVIMEDDGKRVKLFDIEKP
jgi:chemotaxis protein MotB